MRKEMAVAVVVLAGLLLAAGGAVYGAPGDLVFERKTEDQQGSESFPPSIFPHWVHRIQYRCYACHPKPFVMQKGANTISMETIKKGQFCGECHNGKIAFGPDFQNCTRCHTVPEE